MHPDHLSFPDRNKSPEPRIGKLADLRSQLAEAKWRYRKLSRDFNRLKTMDLQESEDRYRQSVKDMDRAQEVGQIGSWRLDVLRNILTWSDENHRIFGVSRGTPLTYETFLEIVHPDDRTSVDTQWKAGLHGEPYDIEHRIIVAGETRWVREKAFLEFDETGKLLGGFGITQDITKQKEAEAGLQKISQQRQLALDAARMGWWHYDPDTRMSSWDERYKEIFDVTGNLWPNDEILSRLHPDDLPGVWAKVEAALDSINPQPYSAEYRISISDGSIKWIEAHGIALFEGIGDARRAKSLVGTVVDITDRKRNEHALKESEQLYRTIGEAIPYGVWITEADGLCIYTSQSFLEMVGMTMDQIRQFGWLHLLPPEDVEPTQRHWMHCVRTGEKFEREHRFRSKDGTYRRVLAIGRPVRDVMGNIIHWAGINLDITERKRAEESLRQAHERLALAQRAAGTGVWDWDMTSDTLDWTPEMFRLFGLDPAIATVSFETWHRCLHPDDRQTAEERIREAVRNHTHLKNDYRIVLPSGEIRWISALGDTTYDAADRPLRMTGLCLDITNRKKAEETLRCLNETLEEQVAERTKLAEGRTRQLQALAVELIEAEDRERQRIAELLHDDLQQTLAAIRLQFGIVCRSLSQKPEFVVIEHLLEKSIATSRSLSHELSPMVLYQGGLILGLKWLSRQMKEKFGLQIELKSTWTEEYEDTFIKTFLFRAANELLFNIVKHAGVKKARLNLRGSADSIILTISDRGRGFVPEILDYSTQKGGFGLLSLRERANYIGGSLVIESTPERGSKFILTVPYNTPRSDVWERWKTDRKSAFTILPEKHKGTGFLKVMLVDDHKVIRQGLILLLRGQPDIKVVGEAANGLEAMEKVQRLKPDVVVMDISMPEMDGIEVTRRIKAKMPSVRVVGLSMYEDEQLAASMRKAGAEAFVSKISSSTELLKAIYGFTGNQRMNIHPASTQS